MFKKTVAALVAGLLGVKLLYGPDVVSDPGSYTYYVTQINQMTQMIQNMQQQIQTLGGVKTAVDDMKRQVYTVQDTVTNALNGLQNATNGLFDSMANVDNTVDDIFSMERDSISTTEGDSSGIFYRSTAELIDDIFVATGTMPVAEFLHLNDERLRRGIKKEMAQFAWHRLITDQDEFRKRQKERVERTTQIFTEINNATDMVNTQKSTASLIQELVMIQSEMLQLQKDAIVAYAYAQYKGVDLNKLKRNVALYNDPDAERRKSEYERKKPEELFPRFYSRPKASDEFFDQYMGGGE